jgi:hypothetical protein
LTTAEEVSGAALQFVRKISGFRKPSRANQEAFDRAVREVSDASRRLLLAMGVQSDDGQEMTGEITDRSAKVSNL